jgi:hypothetical protein
VAKRFTTETQRQREKQGTQQQARWRVNPPLRQANKKGGEAWGDSRFEIQDSKFKTNTQNSKQTGCAMTCAQTKRAGNVLPALIDLKSQI